MPMIEFSGRSFLATSIAASSQNTTSRRIKFRHTHVILAQVDTLYTSSKSDINTVVDQQRHIVLLGDLVQFLGGLYLDARVTFLVSILDNGHTYTNCQWGEFSGRMNNSPPLTASSTTAHRSRPLRMAGVESVTRYTERSRVILWELVGLWLDPCDATPRLDTSSFAGSSGREDSIYRLYSTN